MTARSRPSLTEVPLMGDTRDEIADVADETQPALSRLALDLREYRKELLAGFTDREAVLRWTVGATGATLGRLPTTFLEAVHESFVTDAATNTHPPLVAALVDVDAGVPEVTARTFRERLAARLYAPAASQAIRVLRQDAQEVAPSRDGSVIDPEQERHAAMRPSLSQIEAHQQRATEALLDGFADMDQLLAWGDVVDLATHGELPNDWLASVASSPSTLPLLVVDDPHEHRVAREIIGAWLLRHYAAGTRSRYRHAGEVSDPASTGDRTSGL